MNLNAFSTDVPVHTGYAEEKVVNIILFRVNKIRSTIYKWHGQSLLWHPKKWSKFSKMSLDNFATSNWSYDKCNTWLNDLTAFSIRISYLLEELPFVLDLHLHCKVQLFTFVFSDTIQAWKIPHSVRICGENIRSILITKRLA